MTHSIMTLSITAVSKMILSIKTQRINIQHKEHSAHATFSTSNIQHKQHSVQATFSTRNIQNKQHSAQTILSIKTISILAFSITAISILILRWHSAKHKCFAECCYLPFMLSVVMMNTAAHIVIRLSVGWLNVAAPFENRRKNCDLINWTSLKKW